LGDVVVPNARPRIAIGVSEAAVSLACSHVVDARVNGAEDGSVFSLTMFGVIAPVARIYISVIVAIILPNESSLSFEVSFTPLAFIRISIQILSLAESMLLVIEPRANIGRAVGVVIGSFAVSLSFIIVSIVSVTDSPGIDAVAVGVSLLPVPRIRVSVGPSLDAEAVGQISGPFALVHVVLDG